MAKEGHEFDNSPLIFLYKYIEYNVAFGSIHSFI
jgi:hypothetical protein